MNSSPPLRPQLSFLNQSTLSTLAGKSLPSLPIKPNFSRKYPTTISSFSLTKVAGNPKQDVRCSEQIDSPNNPSIPSSPTLPKIAGYPTQMGLVTKPPISKTNPDHRMPQESVYPEVLSSGFSRMVFLGTVSLGFALFIAGIEDHKALALGPEGPLMEEFWDNMRRYGLYIVTVSTGVLYTIFQPILELLKNPITAILVIIILGGTFFLVSQVLSLMFGISEFAYDYGY